MKNFRTIDLTNDEYTLAERAICDSSRIVYITGKAGTGKSTLLKHLKSNVLTGNVAVLAPTGVAAMEIGGQTISSFFKIPFGPFVPYDERLRNDTGFKEVKMNIYELLNYSGDKVKTLQQLEYLIVDEVSMLRCDTLDVIDRILQVYRENDFQPFGGVKVVLFGDVFQLPPVCSDADWDILKDYYCSPYFFSSKVIKENEPICIELTKVYRQRDQKFIEMLNRFREGNVKVEDLKSINKSFNPDYEGSNNTITITTTNRLVNAINISRLNMLPGDSYVFKGNIKGFFASDNFGKKILPTEQSLELKVGAQVMMIRNKDAADAKYYNGKLGIISSLNEDQVHVQFDDGSIVNVSVEIWENTMYSWNSQKNCVEENVVGVFKQYPLKLAWAITVHKSQGLTFDNVYLDLDKSFTAGQVYVALSRCRTREGVVLKSKIQEKLIKINPHVLEFSKTICNSKVLELLPNENIDFDPFAQFDKFIHNTLVEEEVENVEVSGGNLDFDPFAQFDKKSLASV